MAISDSELAELAATWCEQGRAAFPELVVTPEQLLAAYRARTTALGEVVDGPELVLAVACARGDAAAMRWFERQYAPRIAAALRRLPLSEDDRTEITQRVRVRLLVADGDRPARILEYAGAGRLGALVHVAATRLGLDLVRGRARFDDAADPAADPADPDAIDLADHLGKPGFRTDLKAAFEVAVQALERKERTLLRLSVIEGMSIDELGTMYRVHRATVARWLVAARERLTSLARDRFVELTGIDHDDLAKVGELVESQLSVSMERLLRSTHVAET